MIETLDTTTDQDQAFVDTRDVTVLEVGGVHTTVVTDWRNKCVKSFYTRNNETCYSRLQLNYQPWGITKLGDNEVMVAVPYSNQIVTVAVTPDLVHVGCILTGKQYYSLAVMQSSQLAVGGSDCVDILNMQGELLHSITAYKQVELCFRPWFMCVNNMGHLLVSDWGNGIVTCLTSQGQAVEMFSGTRGARFCPKGICTTARGDVLVADDCFTKVICLSATGEYVRDVLTSQDGLEYPLGIHLDKHGSLFICTGSAKLVKCELYENEN